MPRSRIVLCRQDAHRAQRWGVSVGSSSKVCMDAACSGRAPAQQQACSGRAPARQQHSNSTATPQQQHGNSTAQQQQHGNSTATAATAQHSTAQPRKRPNPEPSWQSLPAAVLLGLQKLEAAVLLGLQNLAAVLLGQKLEAVVLVLEASESSMGLLEFIAPGLKARGCAWACFT